MSKHNQKPIRWWNASGGSRWWDALADLAEAEREHRAKSQEGETDNG